MSRASKIVRKFRESLIGRTPTFRPADLLRPLERWVVLIIIFFIIVIITAPPFYFDYYKYTPGKPIMETIKAPFTVVVTDIEATELLRKRAEESYPHYYTYDTGIREGVLKSVNTIIDRLREIARDKTQSAETKTTLAQEFLKKEFGISVNEKQAVSLLVLSLHEQTKANLAIICDELFNRRGIVPDKYAFQSYQRKNVLKVLEKGAPSPRRFDSTKMLGYPEEVRKFLREKLIPRFYPQRQHQDAIFTLCSSLIRPNIYPVENLTSEARAQALLRVGEVKTTINRGEIIVKRGEIVTPQLQRIIDTINAKAHYYNFLRLIGDAVFVLAIFIFMFLYTRKLCPEFTFTSSGVILLYLPLLIALIIGRVLLVYVPGEEISGYLFPAGAIGMLGIILLNPRIAFALVIWGVLLFGIAVDFNFRYIIVGLFGGLTALLSLYTVRERKDVLMAGFKTALVNFVLILVINIIDDPTKIPTTYAGLGILNGILCAFLTLPALPLFEYFFGIVTDVRLLELTGITQPLLRELEEKAPGTYQHSLNVAKLGEPAAEAIGANYLLVRAGAYYHDIGKILKPKYYSENQVTPEEKRIHNSISPNMSLLIVRNHVKEGIELAKKYGLPQKIIDFIPQHHGTSLIKYFYQRALQQYSESESNVPVREEDFRYLGPKPQSIEAAIVMLADSVEATITSKLPRPYVSEEEIRRVVHETIVEKFNDGQLDECPLTLRDLHIIRESFISTLKSRLHFRVEYPPTSAQKELKKVIAEKPELTTSEL
ncbi:HDIG domain-containing protein [Candidatus Sumerlaeota bacterium]|nr:HDIG domain-containing protein [Candidatus Sumerlaeota bacterium]